MQVDLKHISKRTIIRFSIVLLLICLPWLVQAQYSNTPYLAWSPDGKWIAVSYDGQIVILNAETTEVVNKFTDLLNVVSIPIWSPNSVMIGFDNDTDFEIWDTPWDNSVTHQVANIDMSQNDLPYISSSKWHPNGDVIAIVQGVYVSFLDLESNTISEPQDGLRAALIADIEWSSDGNQLAVARLSKVAEVWDYPDLTTKLMILLDNYLDFQGNYINPYFNTVDWSPDNTYLVYGMQDKIHSFNIGGLEDNISSVRPFVGENTTQFLGHVGNIYSVAWHPIENLIASGGGDGTVRIWKASTGEQLHVIDLEVEYLSVVSLAWSSDGSQLAYGSSVNTIEIIDMPIISDE